VAPPTGGPPPTEMGQCLVNATIVECVLEGTNTQCSDITQALTGCIQSVCYTYEVFNPSEAGRSITVDVFNRTFGAGTPVDLLFMIDPGPIIQAGETASISNDCRDVDICGDTEYCVDILVEATFTDLTAGTVTCSDTEEECFTPELPTRRQGDTNEQPRGIRGADGNTKGRWFWTNH